MLRFIRTILSVFVIGLFAAALVSVVSLGWWLSHWYALPEGRDDKIVATVRSDQSLRLEQTKKNSAIVTLFSRGYEQGEPATAQALPDAVSGPQVTVVVEYLELGEQYKFLGFTRLWRIREISSGQAKLNFGTDNGWLFAHLNLEKLHPMIQYSTLQTVSYPLTEGSQTLTVHLHPDGVVLDQE